MKRSEIADKYKWRKESMCPSPEAWEADYCFVKDKIGELPQFDGKLGEKDSLLKLFKLIDEIDFRLKKLYVFAAMQRDEDMAVTESQMLLSRAQSLFIEYQSASSFVTPSITALPDKTLDAIIADSRFEPYDYSLKEIRRKKAHILSDKEEKLLARSGEALEEFAQAFSMLDNVDLPLPQIDTPEGKQQLTHARFGLFLQSPDRQVRRAAYEGMYNTFKAFTNTITAIYSGSVKSDIFGARSRNYSGALEAALSARNIPSTVYDNLLKAVGKNLDTLHKYVEYRASTLKLPDLKMYDMYVPLVSNAELKLEYEDAYKLVCKALLPLGQDYAELLSRAYNEGWIDVFENTGKRSGAYSTSSHGVHPYVLLNYQKTTHDVFTIAHEMGHAMHSHYSMNALPVSKSDYEIFVAEVASTVNEVLLLKHLLSSPTTDGALRKYLMSYYLEMFRTTLFRQTMFAEFEFNSHRMAENGEPLTSESLCRMYAELNRKYYGAAVETDGFIRYEWSRIPHFYRAFYVFQYSTGIASAVNIASSILTEGAPAVERYKKFLSAGGSKSPYEILKDAGVDLATEKPFDTAMKEFESTLAELIKTE